MDIVRYPDCRVEVLDDRFTKYKLGTAALEMLWTGGRWLEGPVWFGDGRYLLVSDIPNNRILKWEEETGEMSVFRKPSNNTNGNTRDRQGRLISCEHDTRRVTRTEHDGSITVLMDSFGGKKLNAPNDVVADRRKILYPATPNQHDRVLLQVVPLSRDVGRNLHPIGQPYAGDLAECGVRFLRRRRVDARANTPFLWASLECGSGGPLGLNPAALSDQLIDCGHQLSP